MTGSCAVTRHPASGSGPVRSEPPCACTRSRMPRRPWPPASRPRPAPRPASSPARIGARPSSTTSTTTWSAPHRTVATAERASLACRRVLLNDSWTSR
ncbi:hypothetical protein C8046_15845 [Serinibacter arcticus]|uniref:Uncharacterized protein n=1 Tax=Serinibacter arcticus TaxID=1655435 RepID=A0A2U1ZY54_9MICO|nr:hypothetical protein C8046_15845 [Serinibacter arcticus]